MERLRCDAFLGKALPRLKGTSNNGEGHWQERFEPLLPSRQDIMPSRGNDASFEVP
ncbi:hypothetical protein NG831_01745 [Xanthomonas sacchari]|nr:hypothetical protein [Xanthomonas sacchari]UYK66966.1 hypothetical protein NG831_01745 [Xanthomonas sacchari]